MEAGNLTDNTYLPYTDQVFYWTTILLGIISLLGVIASVFGIGFLFRKKQNTTTITMISLLFGDLLLSFTDVSISIRNTIHLGWLGGPALCYSLFIISIWMALASILNICLLAYVRMHAFRKASKFTVWHCKCTILCIWLCSLPIAFIPFMLNAQGYSVMLQPSFQHCEPNFFSKRPKALAFNIFSIFMALICPVWLVYYYRKIYLSFTRVKNNILSSIWLEEGSSNEDIADAVIEAQGIQKGQLKRQELRLVTQSLLILATAILSWSGVFIVGVCALFDVSLGPKFHLVYNIMIAFNCLCDPLFILFFGAKN
jgi:hypothetical protein